MKVKVQVGSATSVVKVHAKELYISSAVFSGEDGVSSEAEEINFNVKDTVLTLVFPTELSVGTGKHECPSPHGSSERSK